MDFCQEGDSMTPERLRAAAGWLDTMHERYLACFGRIEACEHSRVYVRGLLLHDQRKTCESIALHYAKPRDGRLPDRREVQALQNFLTESPWDYHEVDATTQAIFAEQFAAPAASARLGVVGVIDESGDEKSGPHSCGAKTQWFGRLGKTELCQVGVFLVGVTEQGTALLDHQLFLPKEWARDKARRKKTRVPKEIKFRTKPQLAIDLLDRTLANGQVKFDWITADSLYGKSGQFLTALENRQLRYVVETSASITFWTCDPSTQIPEYRGQGPRPTQPTRDGVKSARAIAASLPASAWQPVKLREGTKGPVVAEFARVRVWSVRDRKPGPPVWLVFRRELGSQEVKYYVSNAGEDVSLELLALVIGTRWRVEEFLEDAKQYLGLADYEARGWTSWHHHVSLVGMAHLYVMLVRKEFRQDVKDSRRDPPGDAAGDAAEDAAGDAAGDAAELSLDRAYRLVCDAMSRPRLTPEESLQITKYHLHYNREAQKSHRKSWLRQHKRAAKQLRL
jgi:SRSO17 transposase